MHKIYVCPMHPEVNEAQPGQCPKCGMALEETISSKPQEANYTCPMHPKVQEKSPGQCPECGMALEATKPTKHPEKNPELTDFKKRFFIGLLFAFPVTFLAMSEHFGLTFSFLSDSVSAWVQFILSLPVVLWSGLPFFVRAWTALKNKTLNMFSLIAMGVSVAFVYSVIALLFPTLFPSSFRNLDGTVPVYFESAAVIIVLVLLGQILELKARDRTNSVIKSLLNLTPLIVHRLLEGKEEDVPIETVVVGDQIRIKPGEKVPVDGDVIEGESYVDESMITGESVPVLKKEKSRVVAGTLNKQGVLVIKAKKVGADTQLSHIIEVVAKAQRSRASIQRFVDVVAAYFTPIVLVAALLTFFGWGIFRDNQGWIYGLIAAVSVLVIACPCALGLATPVSIMVGIGRGAKRGILIKDAAGLEILEQVNMLILDKTGTLTEGSPKVVEIQSFNTSEAEVLQLAASLEQNSEHPLAVAIVDAAKERKIELHATSEFHAITGKGITGRLGDKKVGVGSKAFVKELKIEPSDPTRPISNDHTTVFVVCDNQIVGMLGIKDPIKASTPSAIKKLRQLKIDIAMLTGDDIGVATSVAKALGIEHVFANVSPIDKHAVVEGFQKKGRIVAMAGDGINDAPALAKSHVGIAMGSGADVAIESAEITLMKGDLEHLVDSFALSRAVMRNIRQNLGLAFVYNAACIPVAAGALYPLFGVLLSPMLAALAMSLSSLSVIGNALRLKTVFRK